MSGFWTSKGLFGRTKGEGGKVMLLSSRPAIEDVRLFPSASFCPAYVTICQPSIFDLVRERNTYVLVSCLRENGRGEASDLLRRWWDSSLFRIRRMKNPPIFDLRRQKIKESLHLPPTWPEKRITAPSSSSDFPLPSLTRSSEVF